MSKILTLLLGRVRVVHCRVRESANPGDAFLTLMTGVNSWLPDLCKFNDRPAYLVGSMLRVGFKYKWQAQVYFLIYDSRKTYPLRTFLRKIDRFFSDFRFK